MEHDAELCPGGPGGFGGYDDEAAGTAVPFIGADGRLKLSLSPPRVVPPVLGAATPDGGSASPAPMPSGFGSSSSPLPQHQPHLRASDGGRRGPSETPSCYDDQASSAAAPPPPPPVSLPTCPNGFTGRVLEERTDEAVSSLMRSVDMMRGGGAGGAAAASGGRARSASPLAELGAADARAEEEARQAREETGERMCEVAEEVCRQELDTHFKLLRLKNAAGMVPELLRQNQHLQGELARARSARPEDLQRSLEQLDRRVQQTNLEASQRSHEERAQKEKLRDALTALKGGGFSDADLVGFVQAALDAALGVVFRVEEERAMLSAELTTRLEDAQEVQARLEEALDRAAASGDRCTALQEENASLKSDGADLRGRLAAAEAQARNHAEDLETTQAFAGTLKERVFEADQTQRRLTGEAEALERQVEAERARAAAEREELEEAAEAARARGRRRAEAAEAEAAEAAAAAEERVRRERQRAAEAEARWREAEDASVALRKEHAGVRGDAAALEERAARDGARAAAAEQARDAAEEAAAQAAAQVRTLQGERAALERVVEAGAEAVEAERSIVGDLRQEARRLSEECRERREEVERGQQELAEVRGGDRFCSFCFSFFCSVLLFSSRTFITIHPSRRLNTPRNNL